MSESARIDRSRFTGRACLVLAVAAASFTRTACPTFAQPCEDIVLTAPVPVASEGFGKSIAVLGTTAVIAAPGDITGTSPFPGRVFVFELIDRQWQFQAELTVAGLRNGSFFGSDVAIRDDLIAVGSPRTRNVNNEQVGAVFLFERPVDGWQTTDQPDEVLYPFDDESGTLFGTGIDVDGNWLFAGAPLYGDPKYSGGAYVFEDEGGAWQERQIVTRPNPVKNEHFGFRIDVKDGVAAISAPNLVTHSLPGTGHVFVLNGQGVWNQVQTLSAGAEKEDGDHFGRFISLDRSENPEDNWVLIGSTGDDDKGEHSGSAHLFKVEPSHNGYRFVRQTKIIAGNGITGDHFGFFGEMHWPYALVSANSFDKDQVRNVGSVYVFEQEESPGEWKQRLKLWADCRDEDDRYGSACRFYVDPDQPGLGILVGVPGDDPDDAMDAGAVHVIEP